MNVEVFKMDIHVGNSLLYVVNNYPTLSKVVLELVQNALDSDADTIHIIIDYKNQNLSVRDNGCGISPKGFEKAISSVCSTLKQGKNKLGQFGIGLLSPLGKCQGFTITSAAKEASTQSYNRWVFDSEKILQSPTLPEIPMIPMPTFFFSRSEKGSSKERQAVSWRTEVSLDHFSKDKSINAVSLEELRSLILGQFSESMKRLDATVNITIKPASRAKKDEITFKAASFSGERLGEVVYDASNERTAFDIYLASKTKNGRHGKILVGVEGSEFRIPIDIFLKSATELDRDIIEVLTSGTFEGSIISSSCKLHQNRKEFFDNEARMNFLIHLESWVKHHGRKHIVAIKDGEKDAWLQAIGSLAISQLEDRLRSEMPYLMDVIKNFKKGTIGSGHYGFDEAKQQQSFKSAKQSFSDRNGKRKEPVKAAVDREPTLHPGHTPFTVSGKGENRRLVKGHSTGLQFVFEELPGNDNHWELDEACGVIVFNMRSDIWAKMESSERNLILYQQYVAIKALELMLVPPATRPHVFEFLQKELKSASFFITNTSHLHPRKLRSEVGRKIKS
jgi:hypothetical protein